MFKVTGKKFLITTLAITIITFGASLIWINRQSPKDESYTHAPDYSWVTGQLQYQDIEGGFWTIDYQDATDKFGGKFVLGKDPRLASFKSGDYVKITGQISPNQVSIYQSGTLYNLEFIDLYQ